MTTANTSPRYGDTTLPPADLEKLMELARFIGNNRGPAVLVGPDGESFDIPAEVYEVLSKVVRAMSRRNAVSIVPVGRKVTTQQAADLLGISRPTVIKLIDNGEIPCEKTTGGRHRRLNLEDVLSYQQKAREDRERIFQDMADDAEEQGLHDLDFSDGVAAVDAVRRARKSGGAAK